MAVLECQDLLYLISQTSDHPADSFHVVPYSPSALLLGLALNPSRLDAVTRTSCHQCHCPQMDINTHRHGDREQETKDVSTRWPPVAV